MIYLVKIEGTLDEIRELLGDVSGAIRTSRKAAQEVRKTVKKTARKLSAWQRYIKNRNNHIKHARGPRKGQLNLKKMSQQFKKTKK